MSKKRILIVDDEVGFTRLLQLNLGWTGRYAVRTETRATEAITVARECRPDLILLDVMMPEMDGGEIAARLRSHPETRNIPIIFITAAVKPDEVRSHQGQIGGLTYLAKPVDFDDLVNRIEDRLPASTATGADPRPAPCPGWIGSTATPSRILEPASL